MYYFASRAEKSRIEKGVLSKVNFVAGFIVRGTKSSRISIRLRSLVRYAYTAYILRLNDFNTIKGVSTKLNPPKYLFSQHFYRKVEEELAKRYKVLFVNRRGKRYAIIRLSVARLAL